MSVYYDARERFVVSDTEEGCGYVGLMQEHLALMGALMLCGFVRNCEIRLQTEQETCRFEGTKVSEKLHDILNAMDRAKKIDLNIFWNYRWTAWNEISELAGVNSLRRKLEDAAQEEAVPESVFYSCYVEADCEEKIGSLWAYGCRNGRYFDGEVPCENVDTLPEEGFWRTPQTAVVWDVCWPEGADHKRIAEVAEELSTLSSADQISVDEKSISLYINNLELHGRRDLEKFLALCAELNRLTDGDCFFVEELEDLDSPFPRILSFDLDDAGQWHYQIAAV